MEEQMNGFSRTMLLIAAVILVAGSSPHAARFFTDKGSIQLGGGMIFESIHGEDAAGFDWSSTYYQLYPVINFFPVRYFYVGPALSWIYDNGTTRVDLGVNAGFAYNSRNAPVFPFVGISPQTIMVFDSPGDGVGFGTDIYGGIMIPIEKHFSINIGPGFWVESVEDNFANKVYFKIDITGLIF